MKYLKYFENVNKYNYNEQKLNTLEYLNIPNHIEGDFECNQNRLHTLEFGPEIVDGNFDCSDNILSNLEFCPEYVGKYFNCRNNEITSLEFCPKTVHSFYCQNNELTSLEFCPKNINGWFNCSRNKLTSLDFCPEYVGGNFLCSNNPWSNPIPYELIEKHNIDVEFMYTEDQKEYFGSYDFQKEFLTIFPEKYKDLDPIGYADGIKEEFDWLFNAVDMGLM